MCVTQLYSPFEAAQLYIAHKHTYTHTHTQDALYKYKFYILNYLLDLDHDLHPG